jgi:hypothetical protein
MSSDIFPHTTPQLALLRKQFAPRIHDAFTRLSERGAALGGDAAGT